MWSEKHSWRKAWYLQIDQRMWLVSPPYTIIWRSICHFFPLHATNFAASARARVVICRVSTLRHMCLDISKGTFTHARADAGGGGRKIDFNTNHYMRSHMRGRGAVAEREQKPLRKKWVQHPIFRVRFETVRSKSSLSSRNGRSARVRSAYVWTYPR